MRTKVKFAIVAIFATLALMVGMGTAYAGTHATVSHSATISSDKFMPGYVNGGPFRHRILVHPNLCGNPCAQGSHGNMCVYDSGTSTGYCLNDPSASTTNGTAMQVWQRNNPGEPNNDWQEWVVGTVSTSGSGWPWPDTLKYGDGTEVDAHYSGANVYQLDFFPDAVNKSYCAVEDVTDTTTGAGTVEGWACDTNNPPTSLDQLWINNSNTNVINVRGEYDLIANNGGGTIDDMDAGGFVSGDGITVGPDQGSVLEYWSWYGCFDGGSC